MAEFLFTPTPNEAAVRFLRAKPAVSRQVFDGLLPELRARAFTIAGITNMHVLERLRDRIARIPAGEDWDKVKGEIADEVVPFVGDDRAAALRRAELVLRNSAYQAYSVGHYNTLVRQMSVFPWWEYDDSDDGRVRPAHAALDGKIFPANADFWKTHFPPWEHGCRCNVIARTADDITEIEAEDARRIPEARRVIKGDVLARAERDGVLVVEQNGIPRQVDVRSPRQKFGGTGYAFDPSTLEVSLEDLRPRYDPETWQTFETWAQKTRIPEQNRTVWQWLEAAPPPRVPQIPPPPTTPPAPVPPSAPAPGPILPRPISPSAPPPASPAIPTPPPAATLPPAPATPPPTLAESLAKLDLAGSREATAADMRALVDELREEVPLVFDDVVQEIRGRAEGAASTANLTQWTREFLDFVPPAVAKALPKLQIVAAPIADRGTYYRGGTLKISTALSQEQTRRTLWHELAHWLHRERPGNDPWVQAIAAHFEARTTGEAVEHLAPYNWRTMGKRDKWYEVYAGRIYDYAEEATHLGLEVPTRYAELLSLPPEQLAKFWNDPGVRETLVLVLRGFYTSQK